MGHEDYVMIFSIGTAILLQLTNAYPGLPSWLPAVAAGIYKYSVDIYRERNGSKKKCGCHNDNGIVIHGDSVNVFIGQEEAVDFVSEEGESRNE